jgi:hypothetical protein
MKMNIKLLTINKQFITLYQEYNKEHKIATV